MKVDIYVIISVSHPAVYFLDCRAVKSQVEDLQIYCTHGLIWSDDKNEYILDPHACSKIIKYGERKKHEDICDFAIVFCPNNETKCGRLKRKDLLSHLQVCQQYSCQHKVKGCYTEYIS